MSARVCVVGAGRSGAVAAACLAELGHSVRAVDLKGELVAALCSGRAPFHEPGLDEFLSRWIQAGRLAFSTSFAETVPGAHFVLFCVDTPPGADGNADLSSLWAAVADVAPLLEPKALLITRSTVPPGTNAALFDKVRSERNGLAFDVVSNPEFLREGHAVDDFMRPERIVIGARTEEAARAAATLYDKIDTTVLSTDLETAELIKYAANAYLASSISFINEIANICERAGGDVSVVREALMMDKRIGPKAYLRSGIGFGGSCLPKDVRALIATAEALEYEPAMLRAIAEVNELQPQRVADRLEEALGGLRGERIALLGLSFKGGTYDLRSSPALALGQQLIERDANVRAFDPLPDDSTREHLPRELHIAASAYQAAEGASAAIIATDHDEFRALDLDELGRVMARRVLLDGRNLLDRDRAEAAGFLYIGIGRPRRRD